MSTTQSLSHFPLSCVVQVITIITVFINIIIMLAEIFFFFLNIAKLNGNDWNLFIIAVAHIMTQGPVPVQGCVWRTPDLRHKVKTQSVWMKYIKVKIIHVQITRFSSSPRKIHF